jgi:tetratricopeptide (TPR) repeat protein
MSDDERLELQTQFARTHSLQREFDAAHRILDAVEAELTGDTPVAHVRCLLERGRAFNSAGDNEKARQHFGAALTAAQVRGWDGYAVDAAHMIANTNAATPDEALKWNHAALTLAEASPDPVARRWRASLCNNIGWALFTHEKFDDALAFFERALLLREEEGAAGEIRVARWSIGRCLRSLGRAEEALAIHRELEAEMEAAASDRPDGFVFEEIGECLRMLRRNDEATPYFRRAHELLSRNPWLAEHEPARLKRIATLGGAGARPSA